jgi:hypothetical protein
MLRDECGVRSSKWLPYGYLLVPLAALWAEAVQVGGPAAALNRERFKQWFWCSGISAAYDRAANTQAARDYAELRRWINGEGPPGTITDFDFEPSRLREITPKQQSVYKTLMALVITEDARDFHHGQVLTSDSIAVGRVDDHHIFPRAFLNPDSENPAYDWQLVDCILNRTMIDADTNQRIGKRPPQDYLAEIRDELDVASGPAFDQVLESHLLPAGETSPLLAGDFERFVAWREDRFVQRIAAVTGSQPQAPSES